MAKTKRRSRNIARKPKSHQSGFVPQNANASSNGFVPQNQPAADTPPNARAATNRANAQHSTGPRTAEGKARSSQNARKHGLSLQRHAVLEHEDPAAYDRLHQELSAIYEPASPREHLALEEIAHCRWALQRFDQAEATLLEYHFAREANPANEPDRYMSYGRSLGYTCIMERGEPAPLELPSILLLHRYRTHWDRRHQRALAEFDRARKDHRQQLRDTERREAAARQAEAQAAAERRREELHQLRLAQAEAKTAQAQLRIQRDQAKIAREEAREETRATHEAAKATAQQSKVENRALFDALERYLNTMPNSHSPFGPNATQ
jgi:hypothetical protein